ncbi:hypothetical protein FO519_010725, partial [Halicephalobus sp. NKZ332]
STALHSSLATSKANQEHFEMNFFKAGRHIFLLILLVHLMVVAGKSRHERHRRSISQDDTKVGNSKENDSNIASPDQNSAEKSDESNEDSEKKSQESSETDSKQKSGEDNKSTEKSDEKSNGKSEEDGKSDESSHESSEESSSDEHQHYNCSCQLINDTTPAPPHGPISTTLPPSANETTT